MSRISAGAVPFVVMATRMLGPSPLRLSMVKLAHALRDDVEFHGRDGRLTRHRRGHTGQA